MLRKSRSEEDVRRALEKASQIILKRKPLPEMMFERVKDAILNKLRDIQNPLRETSAGNSLPKLSAEDSRDIASNLVIRDRKSPETLLHGTILNDFIEQLINQKVIHEQSKYLNVPQQIRRKLLTYVENTNLENIASISILAKKLLALETTLVFSSRDEEEIEYVCSYVASAVIFGKVLRHDFYSHLLTVRRKDFSLDPIAVTLPLKGCENQEHGAFYRYFLPCPASIYLLRCILFYKGKGKELGIKNLSNPDGFIFEHFLPRLRKFPDIFRRWLGKKSESPGVKRTDDLTLNSFRRAVIDLTLFESINNSNGLPSYPPFLISIQSGKIRSDSCVPSHFMLAPDKPGAPDYKFPRRSAKGIREKHDSTLSKSFKAIYEMLRHLTKESTLNERRIIAEYLRTTALKMKGELPSGAFENLRLATEFVCRMIVIKKDNSKSKIRNQSIAVRNLILNLPHSIPIYNLTEEEIAKAASRTAEHYKSDFIQKGCRAFCDFLRSYLGDRFPVITSNSIRFTKEKFQYPVPLIYPLHVDSALKLCEEVLCKRALNMKNKERREKEQSKTRYRASMARHMINIGFYGSLRESEFTGLRIRNVIFDEHGMIVCVRESKSNNGKRNIPLFALAPDSYQEQFKAYYENRLSEVSSGDEWLFPDYNGSRLNANFMAGRIQAVFKHIGVRNMVFHDLRHGFANFFLLRWFHALYPEYFSQDIPILKDKFFHEPYISRLKKLILGECRKTGQEHFTHGIAALSILIGHGGPIMTLEEYIHTADWLFYLISKSLGLKEISYSCQQAINFLQVSYPCLPATFKARGKKTINLSRLLHYQTEQLLK